MKTLILVRHGKSSWEHNVSDEKRPLKKKGQKDGKLVSKYLKNMGIPIDAVFSSPANRAYSTCKIFMETLDTPVQEVQRVDDLYDFSGESVLRVIRSVDDEIGTVMVFGHNNAFTNLVNRLGNQSIDNLPTTGMAIIDFDSESWSEINMGITRNIIIPKEIRD